MKKNYYIFRHGETFATKQMKWYGWKVFSAPILEEGFPVLRSMAEHLATIPTDFNVSSPILRCRQTAGIVTEVTKKEFVYDRRITEYFFEPFGLFRRRLTFFLSALEHSSHQNILICTHGAVIAGLTHLLTENEFKRSQVMNFPPPGVLTLIENGKMHTIDFNKPGQSPHQL